MFATVSVLAACCAGVADGVPATVARGLLDAASEKAWREPDPRYLIETVLWAAFEIDPRRSLGRIRAASDRVVELKLPPIRDNWHAPLATLVAPHDRALRDLLLRRVIDEAKAALATAALWKAPAADKANRGEGDPQQWLDQQKRMLAHRARL